MKYIKTIVAMVFMLVLLSSGISAYGFGDEPIYNGDVIDGAKFLNKEEKKIDPNNIKIEKPYDTKVAQSPLTKEFYTIGLQITDLTLSPNQIVGGKTVTVNFNLFNNQLSP